MAYVEKIDIITKRIQEHEQTKIDLQKYIEHLRYEKEILATIRKLEEEARQLEQEINPIKNPIDELKDCLPKPSDSNNNVSDSNNNMSDSENKESDSENNETNNESMNELIKLRNKYRRGKIDLYGDTESRSSTSYTDDEDEDIESYDTEDEKEINKIDHTETYNRQPKESIQSIENELKKLDLVHFKEIGALVCAYDPTKYGYSKGINLINDMNNITENTMITITNIMKKHKLNVSDLSDNVNKIKCDKNLIILNKLGLNGIKNFCESNNINQMTHMNKKRDLYNVSMLIIKIFEIRQEDLSEKLKPYL